MQPSLIAIMMLSTLHRFSGKPLPNHKIVDILSCSPLHAAVRRQLYLGAPDDLPPDPISGIPAPIVLPSGIVPDAGAIPPAGAIAPSPLIAPAPAILPANAITEENRATPVDKG